jgi:sugar phosphate isomerase/epimerase
MSDERQIWLDYSMIGNSLKPSLGIFAKTFVRPTVAGVFDAVAALGVEVIQFNFACAGLPSLPDRIEPEVARRIGAAAGERGLAIAAVSGTFNLVHPEPSLRASGLVRLRVLAAACASLGASTITLCTGTRDPEDMWRAHPDNGSAEAWRDLRAGLETALEVAEAFNLTLAVEPETGNVMDSAPKARRLLDAIRSPRLKIVLDPANLVSMDGASGLNRLMDEAFDLLGPDIVIAHAKEWAGGGDGRGTGAPGSGRLDWEYYLRGLMGAEFSGPLLMHGVEEGAAAAGITFLRDKLRAIANS